MRIEKLTIKNFRSYYGQKTFEFGPKLNLILGSNGDGKSTFYEAMEWALTLEGIKSVGALSHESHLSAKLARQLVPGHSDEVSVRVDLLNDQSLRRSVIKRFSVSKDMQGKIVCGDVQHESVIEQANGERFEGFSAHYVLRGENLFPSFVKKYSMFQGELSLDIFKDERTLKELIAEFSDIKDLKPHKAFAKFGFQTSNEAIENSNKKKPKQNEKLESLKSILFAHEAHLKRLQEKLVDLRHQYEASDEEIRDIENIMNNIEYVHDMMNEIERCQKVIDEEKKNLDEGFSHKLLTKKWILAGFDPIIEEFADKMSSISSDKTKLVNQYYHEQGKKEAKKEAAEEEREKLKRKLQELPWYIPDTKTMQSMLKAHRCLVCDREMQEGDHAYNYMQQRLNEALAILNPQDNEEEEEIHDPYPFPGYNVENLHRLSIELYQEKKFVLGLPNHIRRIMDNNEQIYEKLRVERANLSKAENEMNEFITQSKQGQIILEKARNWEYLKKRYESKGQIEKDIIQLTQVDIPSLESAVREDKEKYEKELSKTDNGDSLVQLHSLFEIYMEALNELEDSSYENLIRDITEGANRYLKELNIDDFTGVIRMEANKFSGKLEVCLCSYDGSTGLYEPLKKPNTSLKTTMQISVLLAISDMSKKQYSSSNFPLILDAPTSSFDTGKERSFFNLFDKKVDKQCIIVTKSFLLKNNEGEFVLDESAVSKLNCPIYRIQKKAGFEKTDLSTIETVVTPVK